MTPVCQQINYSTTECHQWTWVILNGSTFLSYEHANSVAHVRLENHRSTSWKSNLLIKAGLLPILWFHLVKFWVRWRLHSVSGDQCCNILPREKTFPNVQPESCKVRFAPCYAVHPYWEICNFCKSSILVAGSLIILTSSPPGCTNTFLVTSCQILNHSLLVLENASASRWKWHRRQCQKPYQSQGILYSPGWSSTISYWQIRVDCSWCLSWPSCVWRWIKNE